MHAARSLAGWLAFLIIGCSGDPAPTSVPTPHEPPAPTAPTHDETAHDETAHDETAHDETAHDETAFDETAHDQPAAEATERTTAATERAPSGEAPTETLAALREARALAREQRFEDAWQRIAPRVRAGAPATLRCEAGYLAFRAGHTAEAMPLVRGAAEEYPPSADREARVAQARCLYNVGLVNEAAGDLPAAVRAYQRSFSMRANRTVYEHLVEASVRATGALDEEAAARIGAIARRAIGPSDSFEALAGALTEYCATGRYHPTDCTARVEARWPAPEGATVREVATITSVVPDERYLAVRDASGARLLASLAPRYPPPDELRIEQVRFEDVMPPAGLELVLDVFVVTNDSMFGGNDCDPSERGCEGATRRNVTRQRVFCGVVEGELGCVGVPTMELQYHAEPLGSPLPCDAPEPALPFGVGWVGDARADGQGNVTVTTHPVASAGVACPDMASPLPNDVSLDDDPREAPPHAAARTTQTLATLFASDQARLERRFPRAPQPTVAPALAFLGPWSPPTASAADPAPLDGLTTLVASACAIEVENDQPRCCPFQSQCTARVLARAGGGAGEEVAVLEARCSDVEPQDEDRVFQVLTRGHVGGEHRAITTLRWARVATGTAMATVQDLRLEDALATPGLEVRLRFQVEVAAPALDQRTHVEADARSTTSVEVLCTAGEVGACWGLPLAYRGRHLATGEDGRSAVIAATGWRVGLALAGDHLEFTTLEGDPPQTLTGRHLPADLTAHRMPRWSLGEPESYY